MKGCRGLQLEVVVNDGHGLVSDIQNAPLPQPQTPRANLDKSALTTLE